VEYPYYVRQFDHRNGDEKLYAIAYLAKKGYALGRLRSAIDKYHIVCANCHAERSHQRRANEV
jgi:hypothetical protein